MIDDTSHSRSQNAATEATESASLFALHERLRIASEEPGIAGLLRREIHRGPRDVLELARKSGLTAESIDDFLQGGSIALNDFESLATAVGFRTELLSACESH